jgi:hypothetical protein
MKRKKMMNRRQWLKNMFGAAVIAAIPKPVFEAMAGKEPKPPINLIPTTPNIIDGVSPVFTKECTYSKSILFVYNKEKLIGECLNPILDIKQNYIEIPKGKYKRQHDKINHKYYWIWVPDWSGWKEYIPGVKEWGLTADDMEWYEDPRSFLEGNERLNCVIKTPELTIIGEVLLTEFHIDIAFIAKPINHYNCRFEGSGKITATKNENSGIKK